MGSSGRSMVLAAMAWEGKWGGSVARPTPGPRNPFCCPVGPTALWLCKFGPLGRKITQQERVLHYHWHLCVLSLERVTQPEQKQRFSIHVDPSSTPSGC